MRRNAFLRTAALVRAVQAKDSHEWTIVLPPMTSHGWTSEDYSRGFLPWEQFLDIKAMRGIHPRIIEVDEFLKRHPGHRIINATVLVKLCDMAEPSCVCDIEHVPHWPGVGGLSRIEGKGTTNGSCLEHPLLFGMDNVRFPDRLVCVPDEWMEADDTRWVQVVLKQQPHDSVYLHDQEQMVDRDQSFWKLRIHLRIAARLVGIARLFHRRSLKGAPFLAVHLRRGDFLQAHANIVPSLQEASSIVEREADRLGLKVVLVATDGTQGRGHGAEADTDYLRRHLRKDMQVHRYIPSRDTNTLHVGEVALVEQVLCSEAAFFIGTQTSMFTDIILQERAVHHKPASSGALFEGEEDVGHDRPRAANSDGILRDRGYDTGGHYSDPYDI